MLIDAFMFAGELDILEIRLHELAPIVDKFVIVESLEHHGSAQTKEAVLALNLPRVRPYLSKIKYVILRKLDPPFDPDAAWARENYQRNQLMKAIENLNPSPNDVLMLSDCDEIPRAHSLVGLALPTDRLFGATQDMFYYNVNTYTGIWHGTVTGTLEAFRKQGTLQDARIKRDSLDNIPNCGWHFSYFGGLDRIKYKTQTFAHACEDICKLFQYQTDEETMKDISEGRDLYHRDVPLFQHRSSDDPRLPKYFLENKERFRNLWTM